MKMGEWIDNVSHWGKGADEWANDMLASMDAELPEFGTRTPSERAHIIDGIKKQRLYG